MDDGDDAADVNAETRSAPGDFEKPSSSVHYCSGKLYLFYMLKVQFS